ncbi:hypothetical protein B0H17DRAFT_1071222 [Mycena rosella]|uniref:Uncharacterized protein n=1 Tax=Mycena rosella TaxID=1033263 RepID=A0AAD7DAE4_MYCRO|nr:hypothetical protein B0H17DRAFT_1071222 [Mycena rosella]
MHCQFSFGPNNAFFFQVDSQWAWYVMPRRPESLFTDEIGATATRSHNPYGSFWRIPHSRTTTSFRMTLHWRWNPACMVCAGGPRTMRITTKVTF